MPIIVNVDVMLAKRKMRLNTLAELIRHHPTKSLYSEDRKSKGHPLQHARAAL